jgi:hypothetical protein
VADRAVPARRDAAGWRRDAKKVTEVMLKMVKLDIAALEKAYRS